MLYNLGLIAVFVFAITGVLASAPKTQNIFSLVVLGLITSVGGGTIRDVILMVPVFWLTEFIYVWIAIAGSIAAFLLFRQLQRSINVLLYLDAIGVSIFAIEAMNKSYSVNANAGVAVIMGLITGIGGGILRDVLAGRPNLLVSQDLYASPILIGCIAYPILLRLLPNPETSQLVAMLLIFLMRAAAIHWNLRMPNWLHVKPTEAGQQKSDV
jgi:uncharacterized membrane protein YeiH